MRSKKSPGKVILYVKVASGARKLAVGKLLARIRSARLRFVFVSTKRKWLSASIARKK